MVLMRSTRLVKAYAKPPILLGYTYDPADAYRARDEDRLLAIRVETNHSCNLRCRYCYARSGGAAAQFDIRSLQNVVAQAAQLGARSIVVIGGGKLRLLELDRRWFGYDWLVYTPLVASGCLQHLYSLHVALAGDVRPCAPTKFDEHPALRPDGVYPYNVFRRSLADIYHAPLFRYVRTIDRRLEGRCRHCAHLDECIGCRGYAYAVGVNQGRGPLWALRSECQQCFR